LVIMLALDDVWIVSEPETGGGYYLGYFNSPGNFFNSDQFEFQSNINYDDFFIFLIICYILAYLRILLTLKIIPLFRHLIAMLWAVILNVTDIILLYAIVFSMLAILFTISAPKYTFILSLRKIVHSVQGDVNIENIDYIDTWILHTLIGILVTLIMANFMIARISNTYSDLEKSQRAVNYRELATWLWEIEMWISKIRNLFRRFRNKSPIKQFATCYQILSYNRQEDANAAPGPESPMDLEDPITDDRTKAGQNGGDDFARTQTETFGRQFSTSSVQNDFRIMNSSTNTKQGKTT
jgi:hypothetical protein